MKEPRRPSGSEPPARGTNWTIIALITGLILLMLILLVFARTARPNEDKLSNAEVVSTMPAPSHERLCSSNETYDLIKHDLFRSAARSRGSDDQAFERLSGYAVARMENAVMESQDRSTGTVNCSGSISIDLPPGVTARGSRTLTSAIDYSVTTSSSDNHPLVTVRNAELLVNQLAGLVQVSDPPVSPSPSTSDNRSSVEAPSIVPDNGSQSSQAAPQKLRESGTLSTDCSVPPSGTPFATCSDRTSQLDRQLADQYSQALAAASPGQRALLQDTARHFRQLRHDCETPSCVAEATVGRIREIRDIMDRRWQQER